MTKIVKARFANGVLTPLEPLELDENNVVLVTIEELPAPSKEEPKRPFRVKPFGWRLCPRV